MKQHDDSETFLSADHQNVEENDEANQVPPRPVFPIPHPDESSVSTEFAKYLTPEFSRQLAEHMFRAKKALHEAQEKP